MKLALLVFGPIVIVGKYALSCWVWPIRRCWVCKGTGAHQRADRAVRRPCRWCRGSGGRLRIGRRLYNRWNSR
jgi:hypothetical protein